MEKVRMKLAPPWITYVNKLTALFGADPDIRIEYDNDEVEVKFFVEDSRKADAISTLLPEVIEFGNIDLTIAVIPANKEEAEAFGETTVSAKELFDYAFDRNPVYAYSKEVIGFYNYVLTYVVFKNRVVQFFNDNLNDIHGLISTLYETIADELFEDAGLVSVYFNTDIEEKVGMPLGEWP